MPQPCLRAAGDCLMSYSRRQVVSMLAGGAVVPACASLSRAQAYPSRPIRLVVPFPPGGAFDTVGRPWAEAIKPHLGTVVVENMGGAGSSLDSRPFSLVIASSATEHDPATGHGAGAYTNGLLF